MKSRFHHAAAIGLTVFLAQAPVMSFAADPEHDMEAMIQTARSKADHEALAAQYETEATNLLAQAEKHERMGQRYEGIELGGGKGPKFAAHCAALAEDFRNAARENQELAALHLELAAGLSK